MIVFFSIKVGMIGNAFKQSTLYGSISFDEVHQRIALIDMVSFESSTMLKALQRGCGGGGGHVLQRININQLMK